MDIPGLTPAINKILEQGLIAAFLILFGGVIFFLFKTILTLQDKRVSDGIDREKTVTIALDTVTQKIDEFDKTLEGVRSIVITLDKKNEKQ